MFTIKFHNFTYELGRQSEARLRGYNVNGRERYNLLSSRCFKISGITPLNIFNNAEKEEEQ